MKRFSGEHIAVERPHISLDGVTQRIYKFPNNYGASIVWGTEYSSLFSDYNPETPYELAIIKFIDDEDYYLDYSTPLGRDVFMRLNEEQVRDLLNQIKNLEGVEHGVI